MNFLQRVTGGVLLFSACLTCSAAVAQNVPEGPYLETDFGPMDVSCWSAGIVNCSGSYEYEKSFIYFSTSGEGERFIGYWAEPESDKPCASVSKFKDINTRAWGKVAMEFDASRDSWNGTWGYCDEAPTTQFNGARGTQSATEPVAANFDVGTGLRILGSWLPAPGSTARRNDMYTFNPDGTRGISDGGGMNMQGAWEIKAGQLFLDGSADVVELGFLGADIELSGARFERVALDGDLKDYVGQHLSPGLDPYGNFAVLDPEMTPKVGDYALNYISLGLADSDNPGQFLTDVPAVSIQFWNETEEIKESESGQGYRDDTVTFEPQNYHITEEAVSFFGIDPQWGEVYFSASFDSGLAARQGSFDEPAQPFENDKAVMTGVLMVKGEIFRDIELHLVFTH